MDSPLTQRTLVPTPPTPTQPAMTRGNATVDLNKMPPEGSFGRVLLTTLQQKKLNPQVAALKELLRERKARLFLPLSAFPHTPAHLKSDDEYATKSQLEDHMFLLLKRPPAEDSEQIFVTLSCLAGRIGRESLTVYGRVPSKKDYDAVRNWKDLYSTAKTYTDAIPNRSEGDDGTPGSSSFEPCSTVLYSDVEVPIDSSTALCVIITEPVTDPSNEVVEDPTRNSTESLDVAIPANVTKDVNSVIAKLKKHLKNGHSLDYLSADLQDFYVRLADRLAQTNDTISQNSAPQIIIDHAKVERQLEHIEQYICDGSYDILFAGSGSDDWNNDEQLESRIAALNILDISLEHLGVPEIEGLGEDVMVALVRQVGADLEKLVACRAPSEKLTVIVNCHKLIVTALDFAQSSEAPSETPSKTPSETKPASVGPSSTDEEVSSLAPQEDVAPKIATPLVPESTMPVQNDSEPTVPVQTDSEDGQQKIEIPKRPRVSSADVLLPLLIYVVVKSNPPRLVSNLRFIQRYRNRSLIRGEVSYCLTNMCAVVSFLENVELAGLGLSRPEVVLLNEIDVLKKANPAQPVSGLSMGNDNPGVLLANRVGKEIAGVAEGVAGAGSKVFTGVVDMSSKVLGRLTFWGGNGSPTPSASRSSEDLRPDSPQSRLRRRLSLASKPKSSGPRSSEGLVPKSVDREMKSMSVPVTTTTTSTNRRDSEIVDEKDIRTSPFDPYPDDGHSDSAESQYYHNSRPFDTVASVLNDVPPAIERFLECDVDDIRMGEVPELLRDYRRLGNLVENLRRGTVRTAR